MIHPARKTTGMALAAPWPQVVRSLFAEPGRGSGADPAWIYSRPRLPCGLSPNRDLNPKENIGGSFVSLSEKAGNGRNQGIFPREREREPPGLRGLGGLFQLQGFHGSTIPGDLRRRRGLPVGRSCSCLTAPPAPTRGTSPAAFPAPLDEFPSGAFPGNAGRERKEPGSLLPHSVQDPGSRSPFQKRRLLLPAGPSSHAAPRCAEQDL